MCWVIDCAQSIIFFRVCQARFLRAFLRLRVAPVPPLHSMAGAKRGVVTEKQRYVTEKG